MTRSAPTCFPADLAEQLQDEGDEFFDGDPWTLVWLLVVDQWIKNRGSQSFYESIDWSAVKRYLMDWTDRESNGTERCNRKK